MYVTTIKAETRDLIYINTIIHECTLGEFLKILKEEVSSYCTMNPGATTVDIFWYLNKYCGQHYEDSPWQIVRVESLFG